MRHSSEQRAGAQANERAQEENRRLAAELRPVMINTATELATVLELKSVLKTPDLQGKVDELIQNAKTRVQEFLDLQNSIGRGQRPDASPALALALRYTEQVNQLLSTCKPDDFIGTVTPFDELRVVVEDIYSAIPRRGWEITADRLADCLRREPRKQGSSTPGAS
jgi:hypothetical protein